MGQYQRLELLVRAMTAVECGIPYDEVDMEAIREGFDLAFPGVRKIKKKRLLPNTTVDIGKSPFPNREETIFECWDEYADW